MAPRKAQRLFRQDSRFQGPWSHQLRDQNDTLLPFEWWLPEIIKPHNVWVLKSFQHFCLLFKPLSLRFGEFSFLRKTRRSQQRGNLEAPTAVLWSGTMAGFLETWHVWLRVNKKNGRIKHCSEFIYTSKMLMRIFKLAKIFSYSIRSWALLEKPQANVCSEDNFGILSW